jgi:hypothetical protein
MRSSGLAVCLVLAACGGAGDGSKAPGSLSLSQPKSGEALIAGTRQTFEWSGGTDGRVRIELAGGGETYTVGEGLAGSGTLTWDVPLVQQAGNSQTGDFAVRISDDAAAARGAASGRALDGSAIDVRMGAFAAFRWGGSEEIYYWIDVASGATVDVGTVGDLYMWPQNSVAFDDIAGTIYVGGMTAGDSGSGPDTEPPPGPEMREASQSKVYTLDAHSGELLGSAVVSTPNLPSGLLVNGFGELLGFQWNGSAEEMVTIDTTTGEVAVRGTVGDLMWWNTESASDPVRNRIYVLGETEGGVYKIYTLDGSSGELLHAEPVMLNGAQRKEILGLAVNSRGDVIGYAWNGTTEDMLRIDPETGECTDLGDVGDLYLWTRVAGINATNDLAYIIGFDSMDTSEGTLYVLDTVTGDFLYDLPVADYPTEAILVY